MFKMANDNLCHYLRSFCGFVPCELQNKLKSLWGYHPSLNYLLSDVVGKCNYIAIHM